MDTTPETQFSGRLGTRCTRRGWRRITTRGMSSCVVAAPSKSYETDSNALEPSFGIAPPVLSGSMEARYTLREQVSAMVLERTSTKLNLLCGVTKPDVRARERFYAGS